MAKARTGWLRSTSSVTTDERYRHSLCVEVPDHWERHGPRITDYFREAHADAIARLVALAGNSLHPAGAPPPPYVDYPFGLPLVTLQGYFGEILAGFLAERTSAAGYSDWHVPAHLFRCHLQAFQHLEQRSQAGVGPSAIVGRTGDDCLAFRRDPSGQIIAVLFCEAKCTVTHSSRLVREAHEKVSTSEIVDILQLVEILRDSPSPDAEDWVVSLQLFHMQLHSNDDPLHERHDLICYVHGRNPTQRATWIDSALPHPSYTGARCLHVYEVRLANVEDRLRSIYSEEVWL